MTKTNINFTPKKYADAVGLDSSPTPGSQACTGWTPWGQQNLFYHLALSFDFMGKVFCFSLNDHLNEHEVLEQMAPVAQP